MRFAHPALVFVGALLFVLGLEASERRTLGIEQLHWSSEDLIQTVPLEDLASEPLRSLWYLHVQPPGLDLIRAGLVTLSVRRSPAEALKAVDRGLLLIWGGAYAALVSLTFVWLRRIVPAVQALATALVLALHPGAILYATMPDSTLLTALLVTWSVYEIWRLSPTSGSVARLAAAFTALFLVRSVFQWPALVVFAVAVVLRRPGTRRVIVFLAITTPVVGGYLAKQHALFGLTTSTSLTGYSCLRSIGLFVDGFSRGQAVQPPAGAPATREPRVLSTVFKRNGMPNLNNRSYLALNQVLIDSCRRTYAGLSWAQRASAYASNTRVYLTPSSRYESVQPVLAHAWWREPFDWLFSGPRWLGLLAAATLSWLLGALRRTAAPPAASSPKEVARALAGGLGVALPLAMITAVSILFESGENMRFRFFVEPAVLVFTSAQAAVFARAIHRPRATASPSPSGPA